MGALFRGWRRKVAGLMLIVACAFACGWIRSLIYEDQCTVSGTFGFHTVRSVMGKIDWKSSSGSAHAFDLDWYSSKLALTPYDPDTLDEEGNPVCVFDPYEGYRFAHRWQFAGFESTDATDTGFFFSRRVAWWTVPYWSIVIPLTMFSAWQLRISFKTGNGPEKVADR